LIFQVQIKNYRFNIIFSLFQIITGAVFKSIAMDKFVVKRARRDVDAAMAVDIVAVNPGSQQLIDGPTVPVVADVAVPPVQFA
jgi:hypothetical protein